MRQYILRRIIQLIPVLFLSSIGVFLLIYLIPGDPAYILAGQDASMEQVEAVRRDLGLDQPLPIQYGIWLGRVVRGDLGNSLISDFPNLQIIGRRLPVTIELTIASLLFSLSVAIPLGILSAVRPNSIIAGLTFWWTSLAIAIPTFWLGILLVLFIGLRLQWLPVSGHLPLLEDPGRAVRFLILPAITLGASVSAVLARFIQQSLRETLHQDFVRTARAKGLNERRVVLAHVMKNALIPVVTVLGLQFGAFMSGAVITEALFDIPGMGQMMLQAIFNRDYTLLQAALLIIITMFVLINLMTDIVYALLDPRIKY